MRKALFAGSFDPVTVGHVEIVMRAAALFDEVIIGIGQNSAKKPMFSLEARMEMLDLAFSGLPNVRILPFDTLTVTFAAQVGAKFLLRGLRNGQDLDYERPIALINRHMDPSIETVYLVSGPEVGHVSSTLVREVARFGRTAHGLVPPGVEAIMTRELAKG
jgi:pantetheine-phosphate adenylyltransferase